MVVFSCSNLCAFGLQLGSSLIEKQGGLGDLDLSTMLKVNLPARLCRQWMARSEPIWYHAYSSPLFWPFSYFFLPFQELNGRNIRVSYATERAAAPRGSYNGGGSY